MAGAFGRTINVFLCCAAVGLWLIGCTISVDFLVFVDSPEAYFGCASLSSLAVVSWAHFNISE